MPQIPGTSEVSPRFVDMGDAYALQQQLVLEERRPVVAARYVEAITNLDAQLRTGEPLYLINDTASYAPKLRRSIGVVAEPGLKLQGESTDLQLKTELKGTTVEGYIDKSSGRSRERDSFTAQSYTGVVHLHNGHEQLIDDIENTSRIGSDRSKPQFVLGREAVGKALIDESTSSPAFNLQLAIAASRYGIEVPLDIAGVTPEIQANLVAKLLKNMSAQVTNAIVTGEASSQNDSPPLRDVSKDRLEMATYRSAMPAAQLGPIAVVLGLTSEETHQKLEAVIDQLEAQIMDGKAPAERWPEVVVGRRRLDTYVETVFPLER